jgi:hypothetical protein
MKKNSLLGIFMGIAAIFFISCQNNPIIGNWKCTDIKITLTNKGAEEYNKVPDSLKPEYDEGLKQLENAIKNSILSINENGKYEGDVVEPEDLNKKKLYGNWTLSDDKKKLTLGNFYRGIKDYTFSVIELSEDTMILESSGVINKFHFTNIKEK